MIEELGKDEIIINGVESMGKDRERIEVVLNELRRLANFSGHFKVVSENSLKIGKGLGFSASGFAALGLATAKALRLDVSVTYARCNINCLIDNWIGCMGWVPDFELACIMGCVLGAVACGPFYPICVSFCWGGVCGIIGDATMVGCAIWALWYCCLS
jgi:hypothetical protein